MWRRGVGFYFPHGFLHPPLPLYLQPFPDQFEQNTVTCVVLPFCSVLVVEYIDKGYIDFSLSSANGFLGYFDFFSCFVLFKFFASLVLHLIFVNSFFIFFDSPCRNKPIIHKNYEEKQMRKAKSFYIMQGNRLGINV